MMPSMRPCRPKVRRGPGFAPSGPALALLAFGSAGAPAGLALQAAPGSAGAPAADRRPCRVDYVIAARLDGATRRLAGEERLSFENRTADAVADLWFHLYLNAFANNYSTHLWEAGGELRGVEVEDGWSWQRVRSIVAQGEELVGGLTYEQPDDGRPEDRTVFRVELPRPVAPGESVEVSVEWESQLPRVRRRTGYKGDFLFVAQWYPKLGVYEEGRGWNCHQFHRDSEFYGSYGTYDVTLDLPAQYAGKVGASGVRVGTEVVEGDRVRTRFRAPSLEDRARVDATGKLPLVHDFTWTADPDYFVEVGDFLYEDWAQRYPDEVARVAAALGVEASELRLRNVRVTGLVQSERSAQWQRHFEATCTALFFYGLWFGEYPYEHVTFVDPAWGARAAGGMEYPTIFTCGTQLFTRPAMHRPESVTVHECGHQFWYGLVGNNEFEAAWLDEGFNSYTDSEALVRRYGKSRASTWYSGLPVWGVRPTRLPGGDPLTDVLSGQKIGVPLLSAVFEGEFALRPLAGSGFVDWWRDQPLLSFVEETTDPRWNDRARYLADPDSDPVVTTAWEYVDRQSYSTNSYPRPAVALRSLAAVVGDAAFLRGMRHYAERWRYDHPYPDDFFRAFNEGAGVDVTWYFDELFRGTGTLDWSVEVEAREKPAPRGFFEGPDGAFVEREEEDEAAEDRPATEPDVAGAELENGEPEDEQPAATQLYRVVVRRRGELRLPLPIEVTFEDGATRRFEWSRDAQAGSRWWRLPLEPGAERIRSVVLDPERRYYLDADMSDNQWFEEVDASMPLRWTERVATQYAHLLHWFSSTGG